jgi:hypothetical protein
MPQYENPLAQDKPRTYATRHRDIVAERVIVRDGEMEVYGHELDGRPAWIRVGGLGHAAVEIKP